MRMFFIVFKLRNELKSLRRELTEKTNEFTKNLQTKSEELSKCQGLLDSATLKLDAMTVVYDCNYSSNLE